LRIIGINKYYYIDGGPERYLFSLTDYLETLGHEVIPFAVAYPRNNPSEYDKYFLKPAGGGTETKLDKLEGGISTKLKIALRSVYSVEAKQALEKLIVDTKPDLIYCLNIVNHLSPSLIDAAQKHGVPVVMRLSDYNLICPSYLFLRDGQVCTECERGYYHALKHRCVYKSLTATFCRVAGMYIHKFSGIYRKVDAFVTPARFMQEAMIRAGFQESKIHHIPTFVNSSKWTPRYDNDGYILYFGRLTPEKGSEFLIRSYLESSTSDPLIIVGDGPSEHVEQVKSLAAQAKPGSITLVGGKSGEELQRIVGGAKYVVVPSLCFDNTPNVVYESFAAGKPVIASALGGLPEQVDDETGILVEPGNVSQLAAAIDRLSASPEMIDTLGQGARRRVEEKHSIEDHVDRLLRLFSEITARRGCRL
jgi:glycosyltransferase involved in cell wall biosynthesis